MKKTKKPNAALLVIACCMLAAFFSGTAIVGFLIDRIAPYVLFGADEVKRQGIRVIVDGRGLIEFSNGVAIRGIKLLPFDVIWAILSIILVGILWLFFLKMAILILKKIKPNIATEMIKFWCQIKSKDTCNET